MLAPPDLGSRWSQRPGAILDYQPPAVAALVAIGDSDKKRLERISQISHAQTPFSTWRDMLREGELDALLLTKRPEEPLGEIMAEMAQRGVRWLWLHFPPAISADEVLALSAQAQLQQIQVWWAQPATLLRAHRTAGQLLTHGNIGEVEHIHLAWPAPFALPAAGNSHWWEIVQAFNLTLKMASARDTTGSTRILQIMAGKCGGSVAIWARCANDVTLSLQFGAATPVLPRLEIRLSEGNSLVCEGGRELLHYSPRGEAQMHGSSGWTTADSGNLAGAYAEDLKRFLARCGELEMPLTQAAPGGELLMWRAAAHAMHALEGAGNSLSARALEMLPPLHFEHLSPRTREQVAPLKNASATLPLE